MLWRVKRYLMMTYEIEQLCKQLRPILGKKADKLWRLYTTSENHVRRAEMAAIIQQLGLKHLGSDISERSIHLPPASASDSAGDFELGTVMYGDRPMHKLGLRKEDLPKHIGVFAITGAGKTTLCMNLLRKLGSSGIPFLVMDWKRSYRGLDVPNLKVFSIGRVAANTFSWNPLRAPPGVHPRTWLSVVAEALERSHVSGQGVADVFIETFDTEFERMGVYDGTAEALPTFHDARESLARKRFTGRRQLWQDSCNRILRTFTFGPAAECFNSKHPALLEDVLQGPAVFELDQELPKPLRVFFCDIVLRWIHLYRLGQGERNDVRHVLALEEAHNLFPRSNIEMQATSSLETIYREVRSFGQGLICITQHPSLLPVYILGNCNTQIYLGLQHDDDLRAAQKALFLERDQVRYLDYLQVGEGVVKIKGRVSPCHVKFPALGRGRK